MHMVQLFFVILVFFAVSTGITGFLNESANGTITLANIGSLGAGNAQIPGEVIAPVGSSSNSANSSLIYSDDFTSSTGYNQSSIVPVGGGGSLLAVYNPWTQQTPVGYVLTGSILYQPGEFEVAGIQQSNGVYDVVYNINNTINSQFAIVPLIASGGGNVVTVAFNPTDVEVDEPGVTTQVLFGSGQYYPSTVTQVETILNPSTATMTVNIQSGTLSTFTVNLGVNGGSKLPNLVYSNYGGVEAWTNGFTVKQVNAPIDTSQAAQNTAGFTTHIPILDSIISAAASVISTISNFGAMVGIFLGMGQSAIVPVWLWGMFGVPCLATLLLIGIMIARGMGE